jgi:hypothetical protein
MFHPINCKTLVGFNERLKNYGRTYTHTHTHTHTQKLRRYSEAVVFLLRI